jgi:phage FluMu protein Com
MKKDFIQSLSTEQLTLLDCQGLIRCYVCNKAMNPNNAVYVGKNLYRCRTHNEATIAKLNTRRNKDHETNDQGN